MKPHGILTRGSKSGLDRLKVRFLINIITCISIKWHQNIEKEEKQETHKKKSKAPPFRVKMPCSKNKDFYALINIKSRILRTKFHARVHLFWSQGIK